MPFRNLTSIHANFPSVLEHEIPVFLADKMSDRNETPGLTSTDAVYAMWIRYTARPCSTPLQLLPINQCTGTNDIGVYTFLTDSQVPGKVLIDYINCVYSAFDAIYASGGRYCVLLNVAPLYLAPALCQLHCPRLRPEPLLARHAFQYDADRRCHARVRHHAQ